MGIAYFDTSALVKLVVDEDGSDLAAQLWDGADAVTSSRLAYAEGRAALAGAARRGRLSAAGFASAKRSWEQFWAGVRPVEALPAIVRAAGDLAERYALRA
ncbi:MAG: type II toxin-antitoxin system VapC family toxin, partial [Actinomycetota bacterium]|nr:type II toxin-antitoxin system VapC family toxin [Actinomycetota bacterium]